MQEENKPAGAATPAGPEMTTATTPDFRLSETKREELSLDELGNNSPLLPHAQLFVEHARRDVYAERKADGSYRPVLKLVETETLRNHLDKGPHVGCYLMAPGTGVTRIAALDLDDHDGGGDWDAMRKIASRLRDLADKMGLSPWSVRSGGGKGLHIFFRWDEDQQAAAVRDQLQTLLADADFREGTAGVAKREIEIFPKQCAVTAGGFGNLIAVPFGRASVPLDSDFQPGVMPMSWLSSAPVPPPKPREKKQKREEATTEATALRVALRDALQSLPADDYESWIKYGLALKNSLGNDGFDLWDEWSKKSAKYPGEDETKYKWGTFSSADDGGVSAGTIFHLAQKSGWQGKPPARDKPPPRELAQELIRDRSARLIFFNGEWLSHEGGAYIAKEDVGMRAEVYTRNPAFTQTGVSNVLDALKALVHLDKGKAQPPCWLDGRMSPDPARLLVLRNGILDMENEQLIPHTNELFTRNALDFDYEPTAAAPARWLQFLEEVWPDEHDCRETLQQMYGYLLTPDTSQQKIPVLVGPTRCGKGTIGRVLRRLLGPHNVCSPSMRSMSENFGMQCMIGKQAALVSDMRIGSKTDKAAVAENLLRISGEDAVSVPRKNMTDWEGRLGVRFVIFSNEAPTLNDPSGALMARYILLQMRQSFLGREDRTLDDQLARELPGILNWAIEGHRKLRAQGRFLQPTSAEDVMTAMDRMGAPVRAFVEDECVVDPDGIADKDQLYRRWKEWCMDNDHQTYGSKDGFGKELLETCPYVKASKAPRDNQGKRLPLYRGIRLVPPTPWPC